MTRAFALGSVLAGSVLGLVLNAHAATPLPTHDAWGIAYTPYQLATMEKAHAGAYGPVLHGGTGNDAVRIDGRTVQLPYIPCLSDPRARWAEDGSTTCPAVAVWQAERNAAIAARIAALDD